MYFHVWFVIKYRKAILKDEIEEFVRNTFEECIKRHNYKVLELEITTDHVHMLVEAKDKTELAAIVRTLKAVSSKELNTTPRFRMGNLERQKPSFWARRYGSRKIDVSQIDNIREYIREQQISHGFITQPN